MGRPSLLTKSFSIAPDELESARYCAKEQGVSLNKYLRLAVLERTGAWFRGWRRPMRWATSEPRSANRNAECPCPRKRAG